MDKNDAERYVRETLRMKIQSLNGNRKAGKYTFGVLRLVYKGMNKSLERALNLCIKTITDNEELYKKYDKNLNGLSVQEIYNDVINYIQKKRSSKQGGDSKYKIVKINDYQQASTYSDYTSWCICASPARFRQYTDDGTCQFYFALRDGWYKMKNKNNYYEEELLGDYGLSMLAICVEPDGELKSCTCRWNHDKGGNDHCMNVEQIEDVLNLNFYDTFVPSAEGAKKMNSIDKVEEMMENIKTNDDLDEFTRYANNVRDIEIVDSTIGTNIKVFLVNDTFKYIFSRTSDGVKLISKTRTNTMYGNLYVGSRLVIVFDEEFRIYKLYDKFTGETITKFGKVIGVDCVELYDDVDEAYSIMFLIRNKTTDFLVDGDGEDTGIMEKLGTTKIYDIMDYQNGYENKTLVNILYESKEGEKVTAVFDGFEMVANNCHVLEDYGCNLFVLGNKSKGEKKIYIYDANYGRLSDDNIYHYFEDSGNVVVVKCLKDGKSGENFGDFYFKLYINDDDGDCVELGTYSGEDFEIVECRNDSDYVILATKEDTKNNLWDIRLIHYGRESVKLEHCKMVEIGDSDMQFELGIHCLYKDEEGDYMYIDQDGDIRQWDDFYDNLASDCEDALNDYCERTGKEYDDVDLGDIALTCCTQMDYIKKHLNIHEFM